MFKSVESKRELPAYLNLGKPKKKRMIPVEEVKKHTTKGDCWIILKGKVYDVSEYMYEHPGGKSILVKNSGGQDAQDEFEAYGHSKGARNKLEKFYLGELEGFKPKEKKSTNFLQI